MVVNRTWIQKKKVLDLNGPRKEVEIGDEIYCMARETYESGDVSLEEYEDAVTEEYVGYSMMTEGGQDIKMLHLRNEAGKIRLVRETDLGALRGPLH